MSESVWARLRNWIGSPMLNAMLREAADRGEALDLEIGLRQKQTIRDALERERAKRRIEELERALRHVTTAASLHDARLIADRALLEGK